MRKAEEIAKSLWSKRTVTLAQFTEAIEQAQREARVEALNEAAELAFKKSAMLANDSDLTRGYACGRQDAGFAIRSLAEEAANGKA